MKKFRILLISIFCFMIAFDVKAAINTDSIIKARTSSGNPVRFDKAIEQRKVLLDETIAYDYAFTFGYDHNKSGKYLDAVSGAKGHGNNTCTDASSGGNCGTSHDFQQYFISTDDFNGNLKNNAWACYSNIGEYNGKQVDVKGVVNNVGDSIDSNKHIFSLNTVHFEENNKFVSGAVRPGVTSVGTGFVTVTWYFTEHNDDPCGGAPINNLKGHTAYVDIDWSQGIIFHDGNPKFYISSNVEKESFYLGKVDNFRYIFNGDPEDSTSGNGVASNKSSFMEIFDTGNTNHITRTYTFAKGKSDNFHGSGYIGHYADSIVKIEDPYNYSLDIACTNCESKNSNGKSIVIQDTTNWEAILNSTKVANGICGNSKLSNYYKKTNDGVYCREEYHISYPNENSRIKVEQGRFFTLNAEQKDLNIIDGKIPNYKSIKVTKIRECRGGNLISFKNISDSSFKQSGGTISIDYNEKTYKYSDSLKSTLVSSSSTINNNMLVQKAEFNYTLKDNVYRYIRIRDNYSMQEKPNENDNDVYKDNLVSNLPISLNSEGAKISFNYSLPSGDRYSKISTAFGTRDYLKCSNTVPYNIYKDNNASESELIKTACGKLFGSARSSDFRFCRNKMKNNAMGNCLNDYSCTLNTCNEKTAGKGEYEGKKWNPALGKCEDKTECTFSNYSALGRSWNEVLNKCCEKGTTFSRETGKCLPDGGDGKCEPEKTCELLECAKDDRPCCVDEECGVYCGYKENGEDICPGKSNINNFIYRVIDPIIPFISQKGNFRKTGDNWCSNSKIGENVFSCEYDNPIVKTVITDNPEVSEDNAMYVVELDSSTITSIRNYNRGHKYDDFRLSCNSDGRECKSKFLREEYTNIVSGKCINNTSFYNC